MFLKQEMSYKPESFLFNKVVNDLQSKFAAKFAHGVEDARATTIKSVFNLKKEDDSNQKDNVSEMRIIN
jgi:hypothetical protein